MRFIKLVCFAAFAAYMYTNPLMLVAGVAVLFGLLSFTKSYKFANTKLTIAATAAAYIYFNQLWTLIAAAVLGGLLIYILSEILTANAFAKSKLAHNK